MMKRMIRKEINKTNKQSECSPQAVHPDACFSRAPLDYEEYWKSAGHTGAITHTTMVAAVSHKIHRERHESLWPYDVYDKTGRSPADVPDSLDITHSSPPSFWRGLHQATLCDSKAGRAGVLPVLRQNEDMSHNILLLLTSSPSLSVMYIRCLLWATMTGC